MENELTVRVVESCVTAMDIDVLSVVIKMREKTLAKRKEWLSSKNNRLRSTYEAVAADTRRLEERLAILKEELNKLKRKESNDSV